MNTVAAFIGLRYSRARSSNRYLSFMTWVSLLGMMLGVIVLIVVVSVMNGFDAELKRRILGAVPHVFVEDTSISPLELQRIEGVAAVSRFARHSALLISGSDSQLVGLYGIDPTREALMSIIPGHMSTGDIGRLSQPDGVVLGRALAFRLGVSQGDTLTLLLPVVGENDRIDTIVRNLELVGTFQLDSELDYRLALMNVEAVSQAGHGGFRITLHDIFAANRVASIIRDRYDAEVADWTSEYGDFFRTVRMEKIMMFLLLTLIVAIAAFSIVSSLSMLVREKQADIAVLRTCGLSTGGVMSIFLVQGSAIGVAGVLLGTVMGVPLAHGVPDIVRYLESVAGGRMLAGTYFDAIPTDVRYGDIATVVVVSLFISLVATLYPAYRAAALRPVEILRYE
ncbi:MAG: lipoprotein-releasing ABC transporter permease subunit [Proteobacteria bacterium]|nr:lipoprotein-releasing ABC transporter permease subunit [Pseudomonadota bacterium]MDA1302446.1 lipoprotein-releasing ABC transporter permease subunit [Pseudomonadota bacterium]